MIVEVKDDLAFSVIFEKPHAQLWLAQELLEFVDHAPGLEVQIGDTRSIGALAVDGTRCLNKRR